MAHLIKIRKGWQNEYLAEFILSKFCFVAKPLSVGEDIGTDLFCNIYQVVNDIYLQPRSSFCIQIKSNDRKFDISKNADYYLNLEIPFFVGLVSQKHKSIEIYSGEIVQLFFTYYGNPMDINNKEWYNSNNKIKIELVGEGINPKELYSKINNEFIIKFPRLTTISVDYEGEDLKQKVDQVLDVCSLIQKNISSFKSKSYIYDFYKTDQKVIIAGDSSELTFRDNLIYRLAESFTNLGWILNKGNNIQDEFDILEDFYLKLDKKHKQLKSMQVATFAYNELKKKMK
jgi:hypothetical protein